MEQLSLSMLDEFTKFVTAIAEMDTYIRLLASAGTVHVL